MNSTQTDFINRTGEIDKYFNFLVILDKPCNIQSHDNQGNLVSQKIENDLFIILKANGFILLYNLIESTVVKSLQEIFNQITDDGVKYKQLSENLKKLWINNKGLSLKGIDNININKIREIMRTVADSVVADEIAQLETSCLNISGNIDAKEIRSIAKQVGFDEILNGRHLVTIKKKRNDLAHGDFSFGEIGKNYSVNELIIFKNDAYNYLNSYMTNIATFIADNKYLFTTIASVA